MVPVAHLLREPGKEDFPQMMTSQQAKRHGCKDHEMKRVWPNCTGRVAGGEEQREGKAQRAVSLGTQQHWQGALVFSGVQQEAKHGCV